MSKLKTHSFRGRIIQDGLVVAEVSAPTLGEAMRELSHYAFIYGQDGPVTVKMPKPKKKLRA